MCLSEGCPTLVSHTATVNNTTPFVYALSLREAKEKQSAEFLASATGYFPEGQSFVLMVVIPLQDAPGGAPAVKLEPDKKRVLSNFSQ